MDEMLLASSFLVHYRKPEMSSNVYFLIGSHILFSGKLNFNVTKKKKLDLSLIESYTIVLLGGLRKCVLMHGSQLF